MAEHLLYRVEEFPEVFADACLRDSAGTLKFLSVYGRDGALMQLQAAMELGAQSRGVDRFHLVAADGSRHRVDVGNASRLDKHSGRLPKQNIFGPLSQIWMYDKAFTELDRANRIGWAICHTQHSGLASHDHVAALLDKAWALTRRLSPIALLDTWRPRLQAWCLEAGAYERLDDRLYPPIGPADAMRVSISDHFVRFVSAQVKQGLLVL